MAVSRQRTSRKVSTQIVPSPNVWLQRLKRVAQWFAVLAALLLFLWIRWQYFHSTVPDTPSPSEAQLFVQAVNSPGSDSAPGFAFLVRLAVEAGQETWQAVRWPSFVVGFIAPAIFVWLTRILTKSSQAGWLAGGFVVFSPWYWHWSTTGVPAFLGVCLWSLAYALIWDGSRHWWREILAGGLFLASLWVWTPVIWFLPLVIIPLLRRDSWKTRTVLGSFILLSHSLVFWWLKQQLSFSLDHSLLQNSLTNLLARTSWHHLVSLGGEPIWLHMPNTGFLNGSILILSAWLLPIAFGLTWPRRDVSSLLFWLGAFVWSFVLLSLPGLPVELAVLSWLLLSLFAATVTTNLGLILWQRFPSWASWLLGGTFLFVMIWQTSLWILPLQVRWQYYLSPVWNKDFLETLRQIPSDSTGEIEMVGEESALIWYLRLDQIERGSKSPPLDQVYFLSPTSEVSPNPSRVRLQPRSNAEWDMIEP